MGGGNCRSYLPGTYHIKDALDNPRTNWRRGLLQEAATTRDICFPHMPFLSCGDVRRPRHLPNVKTAARLESHQDGTMEKQILYFGNSQTGEVY